MVHCKQNSSRICVLPEQHDCRKFLLNKFTSIERPYKSGNTAYILNVNVQGGQYLHIVVIYFRTVSLHNHKNKFCVINIKRAYPMNNVAFEYD